MSKVYQLVGAQTQNTSLSSVVTLTVTSPANGFFLQAIGQNIYVTFDGSTPASTLGFTLFAGADAKFYPFPPGTALKFKEAAASATLNYQAAYYP